METENFGRLNAQEAKKRADEVLYAKQFDFWMKSIMECVECGTYHFSSEDDMCPGVKQELEYLGYTVREVYTSNLTTVSWASPA